MATFDMMISSKNIKVSLKSKPLYDHIFNNQFKVVISVMMIKINC